MDIIEYKTWKEFRENGLLWWINMILHTFGYALCYDTETEEVKPARVKFRGFPEAINDKGYTKITTYLKNNINQILEECDKIEE